jgi:hypothetical protein
MLRVWRITSETVNDRDPENLALPVIVSLGEKCTENDMVEVASRRPEESNPPVLLYPPVELIL